MKFHKQFPTKTIPITTLRRLYLQHKIKRKKVRQEKYLPLHIKEKFGLHCQELIEKLDFVNNDNRKLIFLDEINFTKLSFQNKDWSCCKEYQHVDQKKIYTGYRSVIASISEETGIECMKVYSSAITGKIFIKYLEKLRS